MFGATAHLNPKRKLGSEPHRIANEVAPQAPVCANHNCIILSNFHLLYTHCFRMVLTVFTHRHELVEYAIIEHQEHVIGVQPILYSKEPFRGIVGLYIIHRKRWNQFAELIAIRLETYPAMPEQLEVRPNFFDAFSSLQFQYPLEQYHGP